MSVRVLLVEDSDEVAGEIGCLLEANAYDMQRVNSAREATIRLGSERFDALITNWVLPRMSGLDLIRCVRASISPCPPILLLGPRDGEDIFEAALAGLGIEVIDDRASRLNEIKRKVYKKVIQRLLKESKPQKTPTPTKRKIRTRRK